MNATVNEVPTPEQFKKFEEQLMVKERGKNVLAAAKNLVYEMVRTDFIFKGTYQNDPKNIRRAYEGLRKAYLAGDNPIRPRAIAVMKALYILYNEYKNKGLHKEAAETEKLLNSIKYWYNEHIGKYLKPFMGQQLEALEQQKKTTKQTYEGLKKLRNVDSVIAELHRYRPD